MSKQTARDEPMQLGLNNSSLLYVRLALNQTNLAHHLLDQHHTMMLQHVVWERRPFINVNVQHQYSSSHGSSHSHYINNFYSFDYTQFLLYALKSECKILSCACMVSIPYPYAVKL